MSKAIRFHTTGGPEVLQWESVPTPQPGPEEVLIRHHAVAVNFIDIYFRTGLYKTPLPATPGIEGAGVVLAVGSQVTEFKPGDRVAYGGSALGAYRTERVMTTERLVKLPDAIDFKTAAAMMVRGVTAQFLLRRVFPVEKGQTILLHAAAGGVGLIMCQWARHLGVHVIGVVSTPEKAELARANGAEHVIIGYDSLVDEVRRITGGAMVPVVYDSVGKATFFSSLDCLAPFGLMASYGNASGPVPPLDLSLLAAKGSLYITRPTISSYARPRAELNKVTSELFDLVGSGIIKIQINQTFPLAEAAAAQAALESRKTTGSTVLLP
jgi:NADPH2:quinone reductase